MKAEEIKSQQDRLHQFRKNFENVIRDDLYRRREEGRRGGGEEGRRGGGEEGRRGGGGWMRA